MQLKLSLAKLDFAKFWIYKVYKEQFTICITRQKRFFFFFFNVSKCWKWKYNVLQKPFCSTVLDDKNKVLLCFFFPSALAFF